MKEMYDWNTTVADVFSTATCFRLTMRRLTDKVGTHVWKPLAGKSPKGRAHYSQFMQGYVAGLVQVHRETLQKELEFCYLIDGKLYTTAKEDTGKEKVDQFYGTQFDFNVPSGYVWKGTNKPYHFTDSEGNDVDFLP